MVVDPANKAAYFVETSTSTSNATANGAATGTISDNELFKATWTSTPTFGSSNGGTFNLSQLPIAQGGNSSTLGANNLPTSLGELSSLSIDPTNQILYFATDAFNGGTSGLFSYDLTSTRRTRAATTPNFIRETCLRFRGLSRASSSIR